jgi:hypothetical protein
MADHRLDRASRYSVGVLPQARLERVGLVPVVLLGSRPVRTHVVDLGRVNLGGVEGTPDRLGELAAVRLQPGHVVGVGAARVTRDHGADPRSPRAGSAELFHDEDGRALTEHQAIPV